MAKGIYSREWILFHPIGRTIVPEDPGAEELEVIEESIRPHSCLRARISLVSTRHQNSFALDPVEQNLQGPARPPDLQHEMRGKSSDFERRVKKLLRSLSVSREPNSPHFPPCHEGACGSSIDGMFATRPLALFLLCLAPLAAAYLILFGGAARGWNDSAMIFFLALLALGSLGAGICVAVKVYRAVEPKGRPGSGKFILAVLAFGGVAAAYFAAGLAGCCGIAVVGESLS